MPEANETTETSLSVGKRPRRRPGENRERLIEAGIVEFGTRGYHGASTAAIGALAKVPQPHVYASFATKHELFMRCLERACERLHQPRVSAGPSPEARMLLQAVVITGAVPRDEHIVDLIASVRKRLGERRYLQLLGEAAAGLVDEPESA